MMLALNQYQQQSTVFRRVVIFSRLKPFIYYYTNEPPQQTTSYYSQGHSEIAKKPYGILAGIKEGELFKAGEWGSEICDIMKPAPSDLVCKGKSGLCGFSSTNLDFLLRQNGVKNVLLAGFLTNCCVESTMRSAYELGYQVYTLKDCCAATSVAAQDATFEHNFGMFSVPTTSEVSVELEFYVC